MFGNSRLTVFNGGFTGESYDLGRALAASKIVSLVFNGIDENVNIDSSSLGNCSRVDIFLSSFITSRPPSHFPILIPQLYQTSLFFINQPITQNYAPICLRLRCAFPPRGTTDKSAITSPKRSTPIHPIIHEHRQTKPHHLPTNIRPPFSSVALAA